MATPADRGRCQEGGRPGQAERRTRRRGPVCRRDQGGGGAARTADEGARGRSLADGGSEVGAGGAAAGRRLAGRETGRLAEGGPGQCEGPRSGAASSVRQGPAFGAGTTKVVSGDPGRGSPRDGHEL